MGDHGRRIPGDMAEGGASDDVPQRLREARERSGLSLRQLAKRVELSPSALSQIETGKSRPSVRTLYAIVTELGLSLDELFATDETAAAQPADQSSRPDPGSALGGAIAEPILRRGDRPRLDLADGVHWERLTPQRDLLVDFVHVTYEPGGTSNPDGKLVRHAGREYGVVLSGRLTVTVGFETYDLGAGDSISFNSDEPHVLANTTNTPATAIWFVLGRRDTDPRQLTFDANDAPSA